MVTGGGTGADKMKIAIIGAGNVGSALGGGWRTAGHEVVYALRDRTSDSARSMADEGFQVVPLDTASDADVTVLSLPWAAVEAALKEVGPLSGSILVDTTNPLTPSLDLAIGFDRSAGEQIASLAKCARVVKAFNTTGADNMTAARGFPSRPMMPVAGDDAEAKGVVSRLAEELGFEAVDAGPLVASRLLEPLAMFWIKQANIQKMGRDFAFSVVRR
jgi:predicted dinucleotide-binding enzyme